MDKPIIIINQNTGNSSTYYQARLAQEARAYCKQKKVRLSDWHVSVNGPEVALVVTYYIGKENWQQQDRIAL